MYAVLAFFFVGFVMAVKAFQRLNEPRALAR
jgi:hypothetical protein